MIEGRSPLTLRGVGAVVLALACFVGAGWLGVGELVYFGVLLLAVVAVAVATLYVARRSETVTRSLSPDVPAVGADVHVSVRVDVRAALGTSAGMWRDTLPKAVSGSARGVFPATGSGLRSGDRTAEVGYNLEALRRGQHWLGPLQVTSTDPFGIARRAAVVGERTRITISPAVVDLVGLTDDRGEAGGALHTTTVQLGQGADNLVARPYASGDSMRRIHWRATAHRDELMVRQEEQESTPQATVVFDRGAVRWTRDAARSPGLDEDFERGLSAVVSVTARLVHDGNSVEVLDSDGSTLWEPIDGADAASVAMMTAEFASLVAGPADSLAQLPALFAGVQTGPVVVVVGRLTAADASALRSLVHHTSIAVLLAVRPEPGALAIAASAGWRTAAIPADIDLSHAWAQAADRRVRGVVA